MLPNNRTDLLIETLTEKNVPPSIIDAVIESGFRMERSRNAFNGKSALIVRDSMYGNKQFSSTFDIGDFVRYILGEYQFPSMGSFRCFEARSVTEIRELLTEPPRAHYVSEGSMTFRGQPSQYRFRRKIPSPVRADKEGFEISVLPGIYRQQGALYSFKRDPQQEIRSFSWLLEDLEPNNPHVRLDQSHAYDIIRTEQHYATQTAGLDVGFEIDTAIFFATHNFKRDAVGQAYYERIRSGEHSGVIYCFRFRDPPVKRTQYLIKDFDLFKTFRPERILRQDCGLPIIGPYERNIAITDIDCIIKLHSDFALPADFSKTPQYMFPDVLQDKFYGKLLDLKEIFPEELSAVVEYRWARPLRTR
jgi:hypothetical protein